MLIISQKTRIVKPESELKAYPKLGLCVTSGIKAGDTCGAIYNSYGGMCTDCMSSTRGAYVLCVLK
jgi:hypothetical protein